MEKNLTEEQIADIKQRTDECIKFLEEKQMTASVNMQFNNVGDDNFAIKPILFLQDLKYADKTEKTKEEKVDRILEAEVRPVQ